MIQELRKKAEELKETSGRPGFQKDITKELESAATVATVAAAGSTFIGQGVASISKTVESKARELVTDNPALGHLIQLADKLVDVGKVVPFIAPAFVIIKVWRLPGKKGSQKCLFSSELTID